MTEAIARTDHALTRTPDFRLNGATARDTRDARDAPNTRDARVTNLRRDDGDERVSSDTPLIRDSSLPMNAPMFGAGAPEGSTAARDLQGVDGCGRSSRFRAQPFGFGSSETITDGHVLSTARTEDDVGFAKRTH